MPPKRNKAEEKRKDKIVEDKTFGLKNKNKSKAVQKYIANVTQTVKGDDQKRQERLQAEKKARKEAEEAAAKELQRTASLLSGGGIKQPPVPPGVDPKSIVCEFFKKEACLKGAKCKFSHDLNVGRRTAKIDLSTDRRDEESKETNENWDQEQLEGVVRTKHGAQHANETKIVCRHFLDAIEKSLYGWFWQCPNGGNQCQYRHALPTGYVYKTKAEREAEKRMSEANSISLEEVIEQERAKLGTSGTPVTAESLAVWKAARAARKAAAREAEETEARRSALGLGRMAGLSGRALFSFDPTLFVDDAGADDTLYDVEASRVQWEAEAEAEAEAAAAAAAAAAEEAADTGAKCVVEDDDGAFEVKAAPVSDGGPEEEPAPAEAGGADSRPEVEEAMAAIGESMRRLDPVGERDQ